MHIETPQSGLVMLLSRLSSRLIKRVEGQLGFHGISYTEFMILRFLNESPNKTMRRIELAECVGISASGITRLIAPMEKRKLIEKQANPRDARVSLVKLSSPGARLFTEASVSFEHSAEYVTERLSEKQMNAFVELANKLI